LGAVSANAPAIIAGVNATEIILTNGPRVFHFSKTTGVMDSLSVSNLPVSFTNGPAPAAGAAWVVTSITNYTDGTNYYVGVNRLSSPTNAFLWTLRPDGWLKLDYQYWLTGTQSYFGITFNYPGAVDFYFGTLPAAHSDRDGNGLNDAWELQYFGALGQDPYARADVDGLPLMFENAFNFSPASNNLNSPCLPHLANGTTAPFALVYGVPATQADFYDYFPQLSDNLLTWLGDDLYPACFTITSNPNSLGTFFTAQPALPLWPGNQQQLFLRLKIAPKP
jgi:hypothetical protein